MQKLNRKGFTLIELLSIIIILGLITGITITVVLTTMEKAKERSKKLTRDNIAGQAEEYIYEGFADGNWTSSGEEEYKCVTVQDLVDAGYFKQDIVNGAEGITPDTIIKVTRNVSTKVITSKTIASNDIDCEATLHDSPIIACSYNKEYAKQKEVTIVFKKSAAYEKRLYLGNITQYSFNGTGPHDLTGNNGFQYNSNGYYVYPSNEEEAAGKVMIKEEGLLYATVTLDGEQQTSTYCNIKNIDNTPPTVILENIENTNNLRCKMQDNQSGLGSYKICKVGDNTCQYVNLNLNSGTGNNIITKEKNDVESGKWKCYAKDKLGNVGQSQEVTIVNIPEEANVNVSFIAEEMNGNTVTGIHTGENWTNKNVRLTGTIDTNVETWYIFSDTQISSPSTIKGWNQCADTNCSDSIELYQDNIVINQAYYLYVKYNKPNGESEYLELSQNVKIDKIKPTVTLEVENTNNLKCTIIDNGSGVKYYKICKTDDDTCNYKTFQSNPQTLTNAENGTWICYGKDIAGNENQSGEENIINNQEAVVTISFKAEEMSGNTVSGTHSGSSWTNKNVRLTGTITSNVDTWYILSDTKINNIESYTSGWTKCNNNGCTKVENLNSDNVIINKAYYFYVKYKKTNTQMEYKESVRNIKIDKKKPTCVFGTITSSEDGVSTTIGCQDQTDGSGCQSGTTNYSNKTETFTQKIYDKANNSKTCKITVSLVAKKQYCKDTNYNERCVASTKESSPANNTLLGYVTCSSSYSKNLATYLSNGQTFRYYVRKNRSEWWESSQHGNLSNTSYKLCHSTENATWETVKHEQSPDTNKYFWYAKNLGSGSGDSPLKRAIKGMVRCGSVAESYYPNLGAANNASQPSGYFSRYSKVTTSSYPSPSDNNKLKHRGYSCEYDPVSDEACPSSITTLNLLVIPKKDNTYYIEPKMQNGLPTYNSGPNNWNGDKWFRCIGSYTATSSES